VPTRLILEVLEELGRGLVLARVLTPAFRLTAALRIPFETAGIGGRGDRTGAARLRGRLVLPLCLQPVLRRAHHLRGRGAAIAQTVPPPALPRRFCAARTA
jgi:hypothetical protein